jgi:integrase
METIDQQKIDKFKQICTARGVKPVSVNGYLRHIKAALRYAEEEGHIKKCPKIVMLPIGKKLPRVLSIEEINKILDNAPYELKRYINFLLRTGARRSEAVNLSYGDVFEDYLV